MPAVSNMPKPAKLVRKGVRDMVRICDGRMGGPASGAGVLQFRPEGAAGGPLSRIRTGDWIVLDVPGRRVDVELTEGELRERPVAPAMADAVAKPRRGWELLYVNSVQGAEEGADLAFLRGASGHVVERESH